MNKKRTKPNKPSRISGKFFYMLVVAVIVIAAFAKTSKFDFVNIDDGVLIYENPIVTDSSIPYTQCFKKFIFEAYYKPFVLASWKAEYQLFGNSAGHFHTINWLLHLINTLLIFVIAIKIFRKFYSDEKRVTFSAFALAILFAVNPLRIESVAWATERKDVLFSLFFLLSWLTYFLFLEKKKFWYLLAGGLLYLFSGFSKSMGVTLIAVLFLTDLLYNRKIEFKRITEKIPYLVAFFALAYFYGLLSFGNGAGNAANIASGAEPVNEVSTVETISNLPHFLQWLITVSTKFVLWILHSLVPIKLSIIYPHNTIFKFLGASVFIFPVLIIAMYFFAWKNRKSKPTLLGGLLFWIITLSPALVLKSTGTAIFLSDRYTYIASIGLFFVLITFLNNLKNRNTASGILAAIFIFYFALTLKNINNWKNSETLFTHALKINPDSGLAHLNLGLYYREKKDYNKAIQVYTDGIQKEPGYYKLYSNRGKVYIDQQQIDKAIADYNQCLKLVPNYGVALANRAAAYGMKKEYKKSLADLNKALEINSKNKNALLNRGFLYIQLNEYQKVIDDYQQYLQIDPSDADVINSIGFAYFKLKKYDDALKYYSRSIQINPSQGAFYLNRSYVFNALADLPSALKDALKAQQLGQQVSQQYLDYLTKKDG